MTGVLNLNFKAAWGRWIMFLSIRQSRCLAKFLLKTFFALKLWVVFLDLTACENARH